MKNRLEPKFKLIKVRRGSRTRTYRHVEEAKNATTLMIIGVILVVLGIVALAIPSFTFFTTERVADVGFLAIDVSRPHTIVFNPILGGVALGVGLLLVVVGRRSASSS